MQHAGMAEFDPVTGAAPVALPSMRTSTIRFKNLAALEQVAKSSAKGDRAFVYGRAGMDTHGALESIFCELEGAQHACLASSGMAAITLVFLSLLSSGDHVIIADCAYGPVRRLDHALLKRLDIQVSYCKGTVSAIAEHVRSNTKMLYVESPGSLLLEMLDMPALAQYANANNFILATDNTWGIGFYNVLSLGAHVSVVAGTKYVAGHSDLMLGAVMVNDPSLAKKLADTHYALGYSISADDAWLAIRGARTFPLRLQESAANGLKIAQWLAQQNIVDKVYFPALASDSGHAIWQRDCNGGSTGLLSIRLNCSHEAVRRFVDQLKLFGIGFSWGGFESLVQLVDPQAVAPHSYWNNSTQPLVRLYAGLECSDDLIADLEQAFSIIK